MCCQSALICEDLPTSKILTTKRTLSLNFEGIFTSFPGLGPRAVFVAGALLGFGIFLSQFARKNIRRADFRRARATPKNADSYKRGNTVGFPI